MINARIITGFLVAGIAFSVIASCAAHQEILEQSGDKPSWVSSSKEGFVSVRDDQKMHFLRAVIDRAADLGLAKRQAKYELVKNLSELVNQEVESLYQSAQVSSGNSIDRTDDAGSKIRDAITSESKVHLNSLSVEEVYWERRPYKTEDGEKDGYRVYVLGSLPENELNQLRKAVYEKARDVARQSNDKEAEKLLDQQLDHLSSK